MQLDRVQLIASPETITAERVRRVRAAHLVALTPATLAGLAVLVGAQCFAVFHAVDLVARAPFALALAPLLAVTVLAVRLREPQRGPDIHDRQLDQIIAVGAALAAISLIALELAGVGHGLGALGASLTAVAVLVTAVGTRRLWQLRAVPALLLLFWPVPWIALANAIGDSPGATGALTGLLVGASLAMAARLRLAHRLGVLLAAVAGAAGTSVALYALGSSTVQGLMANAHTPSGHGVLAVAEVLAAAIIVPILAGLRPRHLTSQHRGPLVTA